MWRQRTDVSTPRTGRPAQLLLFACRALLCTVTEVHAQCAPQTNACCTGNAAQNNDVDCSLTAQFENPDYATAAGTTAADCCRTVICTTPDDTSGYTLTETQLDVVVGFDVTAACAANYEASGDGPAASSCGSASGPYGLSGCSAVVCTRPTDITGYDIQEFNLDLSRFDFAVGVVCAEGYEASGAGPSAASCGGASGEYQLSGCEPIICGEDQKVVANACVPCESGSTNAGGDDASGADTSCDATICGVDERVSDHVCVPCASGRNSPGGDDASGCDTVCNENSCSAAQLEGGDTDLCSPNSDSRCGYDIPVLGPTATTVSSLGPYQCAAGFSGTASISCPYTEGADGPFVFQGCSENVCTEFTAEELRAAGYVAAGSATATTVSGLGRISCESTHRLASENEPTAACVNSNQPFNLAGCQDVVCSRPENITGYDISDETLEAVNFAVVVGCAAGYSGSAEATSCHSATPHCGSLEAHGSCNYQLSGCAENSCTAFSTTFPLEPLGSTRGYTIPNRDATTVSALGEIACAAGYEGEPVVGCPANGADFSDPTGCVQHTCTALSEAEWAELGYVVDSPDGTSVDALGSVTCADGFVGLDFPSVEITVNCGVDSSRPNDFVPSGCAPSCLACVPGKGPDDLRRTCVDCTGSTFSAFGSCQPCDQPNVVGDPSDPDTPPARTSCVSCPPGKQPDDAYHSCTACSTLGGESPKFSETGAACHDCPDYTVVNANHTACFACPVGKVENSDRTACVALSCREEAGVDTPELSVRIDLTDLCAAEEQYVCHACQAPFVINSDWTRCDPCPPGMGPNHNRTACNDCIAQNFSSTGVCQDCAPPNVLEVDLDGKKIGCTTCLPGQQPNPTHTGCEDCGDGTYSPRGTLCEACVAPNLEKTECTVCSAGRGPNEDGTACVACDPGHFSAGGFCASCSRPSVAGPVEGDEKTTCTPCVSGKGPTAQGVWDSDDAYTECSDCRPGQYSPDGVCYVCDGNSQVDANRAVCTACARGRTANQQQTTCEDNDECLSAPCQNNAQCAESNTDASVEDDVYECDCLPGWSGHNCATDVLECASCPCRNNGECIDGMDEFLCQCTGGWRGAYCEIDHDECSETHYEWHIGAGTNECPYDPADPSSCAGNCILFHWCPTSTVCSAVGMVDSDDGCVPMHTADAAEGSNATERAACPDLSPRETCRPNGTVAIALDLGHQVDASILSAFQLKALVTNDIDLAVQLEDVYGNRVPQSADLSSVEVTVWVDRCIDFDLTLDEQCGMVGMASCGERCVPVEPGDTDTEDGSSMLQVHLNFADAIAESASFDASAISRIVFVPTCGLPDWEDCTGKATIMAVRHFINPGYSLNLLPSTSWVDSEWTSASGALVIGESLFSHGQINPCLNGQSCYESSTGTVVTDTYDCKCADGWSGQICEQDVDECESGACLHGALCLESGVDATVDIDYYTCTCEAGYTGFNCHIDVDECESRPCLNGATCIESNSGSYLGDPVPVDMYSCTCIGGYNGQDCMVPPGVLQFDIILDGDISSYPESSTARAEFASSFRLDVATKLEVNVSRVQTTRMMGGSMVVGAVVEPDGNGVPLDPSLAESVLTSNGTTLGGIGVLGFVLFSEFQDFCASEPCANNATCSLGIRWYNCTCTDGYEGYECERDADECESSPCLHNALCIDSLSISSCNAYIELPSFSAASNIIMPRNWTVGINEFACSCTPGYANGLCAYDDPVPGYESQCIGQVGMVCDVDVDECTSSPCYNNGTCSTPFPAAYLCTCVPGFTGVNCNDDINECESYPCANGGNCFEKDVFPFYNCSCTAEWVGENCELDFDDCASNPCLQPQLTNLTTANCTNACSLTANKFCAHDLDGFVCECPPGYGGNMCEIELAGFVGSESICDAGTGPVDDPQYPGTYTCETCEPGKWSMKYAMKCDECKGGRYSVLPGGQNSSTCIACPAGKFSPAGSRACTTCYIGQYSGEDQEDCNDYCPAGYAMPTNPASPACVQCVPGRFSSNEGLDEECTSCSQGQYQQQSGAVACVLCPIGRHANREGNIICNSTCVPSEGLLCPFAGMAIPRPAKGYYMDIVDNNKGYTVTACEPPDACNGSSWLDYAIGSPLNKGIFPPDDSSAIYSMWRAKYPGWASQKIPGQTRSLLNGIGVQIDFAVWDNCEYAAEASVSGCDGPRSIIPDKESSISLPHRVAEGTKDELIMRKLNKQLEFLTVHRDSTVVMNRGPPFYKVDWAELDDGIVPEKPAPPNPYQDTSICVEQDQTHCYKGEYGQSNCAFGYEGARCAACSRILPRFYRSSGECKPCRDPWPTWMVILVAGVILFAAAVILGKGIRLAKKSKNLSEIMAGPMILTTFFQSLSSLVAFDFEWPFKFKLYLEWLSVFNFNLELAQVRTESPTFPSSLHAPCHTVQPTCRLESPTDMRARNPSLLAARVLN